jgi:hypothetical protein
VFNIKRLKESALNLALDRVCRSNKNKSFLFVFFIFVSDLQDVNKKLFFFVKFFCLLLFEGKKIESHKEVTKQYESMLFLLILFDDRKIRIRNSDLWIRIREAQKHMNPTDPDPQHYLMGSPFKRSRRRPTPASSSASWSSQSGSPLSSQRLLLRLVVLTGRPSHRLMEF